MGDSGHGSPAHPSLASSRRKVEMIKQVKDKNKVVVVEVGEIVTLVEQCEAKTGDKEPKFLIKKKDGHKYKVKDSYFKEWVDHGAINGASTTSRLGNIPWRHG